MRSIPGRSERDRRPQPLVAEQLAKLPVIPVAAGVWFQPIDAGEVAARLVELALGKPAGLVPEMVGPRAYRMADLVRGYRRARHMRRLMVPIWLSGRAASTAALARTCLGQDLWVIGPGKKILTTSVRSPA